MREKEVMTYIWELESYYVEDIVARFGQSVPPYTTVAPIVRNSKREKYIEVQRVGNMYLYTPTIKESEYKRSLISGVVRNYFENSYKEMVPFSVKDQKILINDLKEITDMIEKGKEN